MSKAARLMMAMAALAGGVLGSLALTPVREFVRSLVPLRLIEDLNGFRFGYDIDYNVRIRMDDGIELAATLYLPRNKSEKQATVFIRHPYDRLPTVSSFTRPPPTPAAPTPTTISPPTAKPSPSPSPAWMSS